MAALDFKHRNIVFISPHADDVAWSCGGVAAAWGKTCQTTVVTVFDAPPPESAGDLDSGSFVRLASTGKTRGADNDAAMDALGVRGVSLGLDEAAYREVDGRRLYTSALAVRRTVHPADRAAAQARSALAPHLTAADIIVAPLGARSHVDHTIARDAALGAAPPGARIFYYLEFPYTNEAHVDGFHTCAAPCDVEAWLRAALMYSSEIAKYFIDNESFREKILTWIERMRLCGERDQFVMLEALRPERPQ